MPNKSLLKFIYELAWGILCLVLIKQGIFRNRVPTYIKQIYYINLDNRQDRNTFMLEHVVPRFQQKGIPYARVRARRGNGEHCVSYKNQTKRCKGIVGIIKSKMEALFAIAVAIGWAYNQISNQNQGDSFFSNMLGVFTAFGTMFIGGLVIFAIVMFFVFLLDKIFMDSRIE